MSDLKATGQVLRNKGMTPSLPPAHQKKYSSMHINQLGFLLKCRLSRSGLESEILTVILVRLSTLKAERS